MAVPLAFIIEDDEVIASIFATAVQDAGYETRIILNGKEAMSELDEQTPALIILDMHLPEVPGVYILKAIRNNSQLSQTRVIVVSADATLTEYLREEADLVLVKPVGFQQLKAMAERLKPAGT